VLYTRCVYNVIRNISAAAAVETATAAAAAELQNLLGFASLPKIIN
jgi:hypothetical protein